MLPCRRARLMRLLDSIQLFIRNTFYDPLRPAALIGSAVVHLGILVVLSLLFQSNIISNRFLVLGAHSSKESHVYFKSIRAPAQTGTSSVVSSRGSRLRGKKRSDRSPKGASSTTAIQKAAANQIPELNEKKGRRGKKGRQKKKSKKKKQAAKKQEKIVEQKLTEEKKPEMPSAAQPPESKDVPHAAAATESESTDAKEPEELQFNTDGVGYVSQDMVLYQQAIQSEVARRWHPPVGVAKGTECSVRFFLSKQGIVEKCDIIKPSGMVIYDLSIVRVARSFQFDQLLWGKVFTIDFRQ